MESSCGIISTLPKKALSWLDNSKQAFPPHLQKHLFIDICGEMHSATVRRFLSAAMFSRGCLFCWLVHTAHVLLSSKNRG